MTISHWDPTQFFTSAPPRVPFALLVLNQPINQHAYKVLKKHACFTICADGGANRFYEAMKRRGKESIELPDAVVGDLDSILPHVQQHYESLNVSVIRDTDQNSTDFTKCLRYLSSNGRKIISRVSTSTTTPADPKQEQPTPPVGGVVNNAATEAPDDVNLDIIVLGGLGGRVDQAFSQIHHLYTTSRAPPSTIGRPRGDLYLISEESITFVLRSGRNIIRTPRSSPPPSSSAHPKPNSHTTDDDDSAGSAGYTSVYLLENIGILPVGGPAVINTRGLEWDVRDWKTEFGDQVSTSNHIRADEIEIDTDVPVLFTVEMAEGLKCSGAGEG
ncbi:hypothetical protein AJ80_05589 [Polytolypa hystricis UAMH7299]|uniref:Thiamine pyrophosphokinase n=1 Tax=Polytolypa hystricis (strain UAMH7299) TaxID=1447883 RepID=A0A2B7Y2I9_POLH7|nr:hypothetical protein AJ80_05589 [Polytolypa hystricis UAMH7299]